MARAYRVTVIRSASKLGRYRPVPKSTHRPRGSRSWTSSALGLGMLAATQGLVPLAAAQQQTLNAQDADIRAFIADVARQTGRSFIIDPRVQGTVTLFSERPLNDTEMFEVFLSTLRANGLAAIPAAGGALLITVEEGLAQQAGTAGINGRFTTEIFRLSSQDAQSAIETLRPLIGRQGQILANKRSNTIVIADYADNLKRLRGIIAQLDHDYSEIRTVSLVNSSAREIAEAVKQIFGATNSPDGAPGGSFSIVAVESSNSVVVRGDAELVARYASLVGDLDRRAESNSDIRVIRLQHADAEQLLPVLQQLVGNSDGFVIPASTGQSNGRAQSVSVPAVQNNGGGEAGAISGAIGRARIARYADANALIISADAETQKTLAEVVRQLDVRREQVLVEAIVVEVSDTAARQLGVQFILAGREGSNIPFAATNFSNNAPNVLAVTGALEGQGRVDDDTLTLLRNTAVQSLLGLGGGIFGVGGQIAGGDATLGVILNAVKNDNASSVLSTPSVTTLDNEDAHILVGQEVPVSTGEALGSNNTNPFRTIERRDVGVQLTVRPQINAGGAITLHIKQEVSNVVGVADPAIAELVFNKRELETTVLADDGEIIVLGGLLDQSQTRSKERVPLVGDIPYAGNLFRNSRKTKSQTNLMVFLRPRIIRNIDDARAVTTPRYRSIRDAQLKGGAGGITPIEELIRNYLRTTPPGDAPPETQVKPQRLLPVPPPAENRTPNADAPQSLSPRPIAPASGSPAALGTKPGSSSNEEWSAPTNSRELPPVARSSTPAQSQPVPGDPLVPKTAPSDRQPVAFSSPGANQGMRDHLSFEPIPHGSRWEKLLHDAAFSVSEAEFRSARPSGDYAGYHSTSAIFLADGNPRSFFDTALFREKSSPQPEVQGQTQRRPFGPTE